MNHGQGHDDAWKHIAVTGEGECVTSVKVDTMAACTVDIKY